MRELRAQGLSMYQVAIRLNEEGVPTARGGAWYRSTIRNLEKSDHLDQAGELGQLRPDQLAELIADQVPGVDVWLAEWLLDPVR